MGQLKIITKDDMLSYLDARIKIAKDHVEFYKKQRSLESYILDEYEMLKAIKNEIEKT